MTELNEQEIRKKLGLQDKHEFSVERMRWNLSNERVNQLGYECAAIGVTRGTGRTLSILVTALATISEGRRVFVAGHDTMRSRDLLFDLNLMAKKLDLDTSLIEHTAPNEHRLGIVRFHDHYWGS